MPPKRAVYAEEDTGSVIKDFQGKQELRAQFVSRANIQIWWDLHHVAAARQPRRQTGRGPQISSIAFATVATSDTRMPSSARPIDTFVVSALPVRRLHGGANSTAAVQPILGGGKTASVEPSASRALITRQDQ